MSLLDTASLLLTPNAYKEGKLYSVIPSDGSGDFTFTRATTATRVNSDGLVELVPYNLVERSEQFENAYWSKDNSSVTANTAAAPNGTMTADTVTLTFSSGRISKSIALTSNIDYTLSVYAKNIDASNNRIGMLCFNNANTLCGATFDLVGSGLIYAVSNATGVIESVGNGWYRCSITFNSQSGATTPTIRIVGNAAGSSGWTTGESIYAWGAQLVEGTNALPYQKTETRLNRPRVDFSLPGCPNLLLEPQRTNLLTYSNSFSFWTLSGDGVGQSITSNYATSPDGNSNATRLQLDKTGGTFSRISIPVTGTTSGVSVCYTIYLKSNSGTSNVYIQAGPNISSVINVTNEWTRYQVIGNASGGTTTCFVGVADSVSGTSETADILIYGAQLEAGSYATSYIPTTTASVTRNNEVSNLTNVYTSGKISASGGTWFMELKGHTPLERANSTGGIFLNTGTFNTTGNGFTLRNVVSGSARFRITKIIASVNTNLFQIATDNAKVAIKWNGTTADIFVNGVKEISATDFAITAMENLYLDGTNRQVFINSMLLAPTPLTDDECIQLTTI